MPQRSARFGFDVPDDFPLSRLERVHSTVSDGPGSIYANDQELWGHWAGGCNGVLFRYIGAAQADEAWASSSAASVSSELEERVRQEQFLFAFFTSALARSSASLTASLQSVSS
jgi:hypothetical protein